jgi:hypothetical protein
MPIVLDNAQKSTVDQLLIKENRSAKPMSDEIFQFFDSNVQNTRLEWTEGVTVGKPFLVFHGSDKTATTITRQSSKYGKGTQRE